MTIRLSEPISQEQFLELKRLLSSARTFDRPLPALVAKPIVDYPWHKEKFRRQAASSLDECVSALNHRHQQEAEAAWRDLTTAVQKDQISFVRHVSKKERLALQTLGSTPVPEQPVLFRDHRSWWRVYSFDARHGIRLPERANRVKETWESVGSPFAAYYLADEVPTEEGVLTRMASHKVGTVAAAVAVAGAEAARGLATALIAPLGAIASLAMLDPILIGVVSTDGVTGDWYALERWNH